MSGELSAEAERAIELEERAHRIRLAMFRTPGLVERLQEGYEASERGEVVSLEEVDRELDRLDAEEAAPG
jgi:hypothetical protein